MFKCDVCGKTVRKKRLPKGWITANSETTIKDGELTTKEIGNFIFCPLHLSNNETIVLSILITKPFQD